MLLQFVRFGGNILFSLLNTGGIRVELTVILAQKIAGLAIYIALGFLAVRLKVLTFQDSKALSTFALYFLVPCAMLDAYQYEFSMEKLVGMGVSFAASMVVVLVFALLTAALRRPMHLNVVEYTSLEYPNAGNFMLPLVAAAMGGEWVIYCSASFFVMNVLMFTHGMAVLSGQKKFSLSMLYKNVVMLANIAGLIMFLLHWRLPGLLGSTVSTLGDMMGPVYMFTIGMILGNADLKAVFTNARVWFITFGRLVVYPAAAVIVLCFCGVFRLHPQAREIITVGALTAGAPAAVMVTQFTQMYRTESEAQFASAVNIMTSVLCLATMPLISWLYQTLAY